MRLPWLGLLASTALTLSAVVSLARADAPAPEAVVTHYADMAEAMYADAHSAAADLQKAVEALIAAPSEDTLERGPQGLARCPSLVPADGRFPLRQSDRR